LIPSHTVSAQLQLMMPAAIKTLVHMMQTCRMSAVATLTLFKLMKQFQRSRHWVKHQTMTQRVACFTGRFQPFHNQHLEVLSALSHKFDRIIIGVTNPDVTNLQEHIASQHRHTDNANPFSFESRVKIIKDSIARNSELMSVEIEIIRFDLTTQNPGRFLQAPYSHFGFSARGKQVSWRCFLAKASKLSNFQLRQ
jgi:cytidyltransferase-like protein